MDEALSWACVGLIYVGLAAAAVLLLQARGVSSRFDRAHLLNRMCFLCFPKVGFQRKKKSLLEINVFPGVLTNWAVFLARWPQDFPVGVRLPFFLSFWGFNGFPFIQSTNQKRVPFFVAILFFWGGQGSPLQSTNQKRVPVSLFAHGNPLG